MGLIAQNNVEIPRYAPLGASGSVSQQDMEIDAAVIAQQGKESCNAADASGNNYGPIRDMLTIYGSVSSFHTPYRATVSNGNTLGGFVNGTNTYDAWLLKDPPPLLPDGGQLSDYQLAGTTQRPGCPTRLVVLVVSRNPSCASGRWLAIQIPIAPSPEPGPYAPGSVSTSP